MLYYKQAYVLLCHAGQPYPSEDLFAFSRIFRSCTRLLILVSLQVAGISIVAFNR